MSFIKYYQLKPNSFIISNGEERIIPGMNAEKVKDKELFHDLFTKESGGTEFNTNEIKKVVDKEWKLDYLEPEHLDDSEVDFICDFHNWIGKQPDRIFGYPISDKLKGVLDSFNLYTKKFYDAQVFFKNEYHQYFLWEHQLDGFDKFVDFNHSTFCERKRNKEMGNEVVKVKNYDQLSDIEDEKEWRDWAFKRAVMKPEFKNVDCMPMPYPYQTLISERLKNALEEANITGIEIEPFHVEIEYLD